MKDEYIIINKTAIQKRIKELEEEQKQINEETEPISLNINLKKQILIREILSQSTPLIPELQKTWNTAYIDAMSIDEETYKPLFFEDYIANLKLNI
jgi:hypothetical protein